MKTVMQVLLVALLMGGLSAAACVVWQKQHAAPVETSEEPEAADETTAEPVDAPEDPKSTLEPASPSKAKPPESESPHERPDEPPVAVRPPYVEDADEAGRLVKQLRERLAATSRKESRLSERQEALQLIFSDIRGEQTHVTKLRRQIADELEDATQAAQESLRSAQEERDLLRRELETLQKNPPQPKDQSAEPAGDDNANLKRMGAIYDSMPAETAARIFQQLVKGGRQDAVVHLLYAMKDRQAGKILTAIADTDPPLAAMLTERLKRLKNPHTATVGK